MRQIEVCMNAFLNAQIVSVHIIYVRSGSVVVTADDFESARPGLNPEWGPIYYEASITAQGSPEPSSLRGSTLGTYQSSWT